MILDHEVVRVRRAVALAPVAGLRQRLEVVTAGRSAGGDRHDVVDDQPSVRRTGTTATAPEAIPLEHERANS